MPSSAKVFPLPKNVHIPSCPSGYVLYCIYNKQYWRYTDFYNQVLLANPSLIDDICFMCIGGGLNLPTGTPTL